MAEKDGNDDGFKELGFDPLFGIDDPLEPLTRLMVGLRRSSHSLEIQPAQRCSETVSLALDSLLLQSSHDEASGTFYLDAELTTHLAAAVRLQQIQVVFRGEEDELLDQDGYWANMLTIPHHSQALQGRDGERSSALVDFSPKPTTLHLQFGLGGGTVEQARTMELFADYEFDFSQAIATGTCSAPPLKERGSDPYRVAWPIAMQSLIPGLGEPSVEVEASMYAGFRYETQLEVLLKLTELSASRNHTRELLVSLRDHFGGLVATESNAVTMNGPMSPSFVHVRFSLPREEIMRVRRFDLTLEGTCTRCELLGVFKISAVSL